MIVIYLSVCATGDDLILVRMVANSFEQSVGQHHLISDKTSAGIVCQCQNLCKIMRHNQHRVCTEPITITSTIQLDVSDTSTKIIGPRTRKLL